jgi:outer membrane lipoprotein
VLLALLLGGCATVPPPLQGAWAPRVPHDVGPQDVGSSVRWGGRLVALRPQGAGACFEVIAQPLAANGQPDGSDASLGRFIACREGRYDPEVFRPNRELTITGRIESLDGPPRVAAAAVVLWPRR